MLRQVGEVLFGLPEAFNLHTQAHQRFLHVIGQKPDQHAIHHQNGDAVRQSINIGARCGGAAPAVQRAQSHTHDTQHHACEQPPELFGLEELPRCNQNDRVAQQG